MVSQCKCSKDDVFEQAQPHKICSGFKTTANRYYPDETGGFYADIVIYRGGLVKAYVMTIVVVFCASLSLFPDGIPYLSSRDYHFTTLFCYLD